MLNEIYKKVLTIGCEYRPPKGGIAQVLDTYDATLYPDFQFVANSIGGGKIRKLLKCISALIAMTIRLIFSRRIRIVHIHTASYNSFRRSALFIRLAKALRRKVVVHIHGGGFKEYYSANTAFVGRHLQAADCVIALSRSWREFFEKEAGLGNVRVVHNIVPEPECESIDRDGMLHGLFLGKICKEKGIFDLLQAINSAKENLSGRFMLHIGGAGEVAQLQSYIEANNLQKLIAYEGWVDARRKPHLLSLCQLYILPSYTEGLPISILEAMSYGAAILSTPVGGIPEVVSSDIGCLEEAGDIQAFAKRITEFAGHPEVVQTMGANAKKHILPYLPNNVAHELTDIYTSLL